MSCPNHLGKGTSVRRLYAVLAVSTIATALLVSPVGAGGGAHAGGFCAGAPFRDARGTTVEMGKYCFSPTVIRVQPGDEVTWTNFDPDLHMLGGVTNVFGDMHTEIEPKQSISYTFNEEGVFPYVCILHPGMAGAVVVGDGEGKVSKASVTGGMISDPPDEDTSAATETEATTAELPASEPASSNEPSTQWLLALTLVMALAMAAAFWLPRRKTQQVEG